MKSYNKAGAGNGAGALPFHIGHLGRAVPDLLRYACRAPRKIRELILISLRRYAAGMSEKIRMRDGDTILIMVKDGLVIHHS